MYEINPPKIQKKKKKKKSEILSLLVYERSGKKIGEKRNQTEEKINSVTALAMRNCTAQSKTVREPI